MEMPHWTREVIESVQFSKKVEYRFKQSCHMNVNEHRVYRTLVKLLGRAHPGCRAVFFGDSAVSCAVVSKGRSSSRALNRLQASTLPYILGCGIRVAPLRVDSATNPADDPTRDREVRGPSRCQPFWWRSLLQDDTAVFDGVVACDLLRRPLNFWARLVWRLSKGFDPTLGFPGEGPRREPGSRRADLDLPRLSYAETRTRSHATRLFWEHVAECEVDRGALERSGLLVGAALRSYGKKLYADDRPLYLLVEAILGVRDAFRISDAS